MDKTMFYLACPYTHESAEVMEYRFKSVNRVAAGLIAAGQHVFSPISHSHPIAQEGLAVDFGFWKDWNMSMLDRCDALLVIKLDGWLSSAGVQAEIWHARQSGKTIEFIEV